MISNEIVANYKVVYLIEIYNFGFGQFSIYGGLYNSKNWISKFERFKQNSRTINGLKWKNHQLQSYKSCRVYKVCFHLILFEEVMNFIVLQHGYNHHIIQQVGGEKCLHRWFIRWADSDEEHIITDSWWCKSAVTMDCRCRFLLRTSCDNYHCRFY